METNPKSLIGRTVAFFCNTWHRKPFWLRGTVICTGRAPDTVIIQADAQKSPIRRNYDRQKAWRERARVGGGLHCRTVSEIEVLA